MGGRIYTEVTTVDGIEIYNVVVPPSGVLSARIGSLAVLSPAGGPVSTWQNTNGALAWIRTNQTPDLFFQPAPVTPGPVIGPGPTPPLPIPDMTAGPFVLPPLPTGALSWKVVVQFSYVTSVLAFVPGSSLSTLMVVDGVPDPSTFRTWLPSPGTSTGISFQKTVFMSSGLHAVTASWAVIGAPGGIFDSPLLERQLTVEATAFF